MRYVSEDEHRDGQCGDAAGESWPWIWWQEAAPGPALPAVSQGRLGPVIRREHRYICHLHLHSDTVVQSGFCYLFLICINVWHSWNHCACKISNVDCTKHKPKLKSAQNQVFVGLKGLISPTITVNMEPGDALLQWRWLWQTACLWLMAVHCNL